MPNIVRIILLVAPWLSISLIPKRSFKQFLPVTLFASTLVAGLCALAVPYKWWVVEGGLKNKLLNDGSFILGPFFVGTIWIFHFTFGNFKRYLLINLLIDLFFSYPLNWIFQRMRLYKLVHFTPKHIFSIFTLFAFIIYGYKLLLSRLKIFYLIISRGCLVGQPLIYFLYMAG